MNEYEGILAFHFDAEHINICESPNEGINIKHREEKLNLKMTSCITPDIIVNGLMEIVNERKPLFIYVSISNENMLQSYSLDLLKSTIEGDRYNRYIEIKKNTPILLKSIKSVLFMESSNYRNNTSMVIKNKSISFDYKRYGALCTQFSYNIGGRSKFISLVACNLPLDTASLHEKFYQIRNEKSKVLNDIRKKFLLGPNGNEADFAIVMGNLGYLLNTSSKDNVFAMKMEDLLLKDYIIQGMVNHNNEFKYYKEGVSGDGPDVLPTFKMLKERNVEYCEEHKKDDKFDDYYGNCLDGDLEKMGWNSRILYINNNVYQIQSYDSLEENNSRRFSTVGIFSYFK